jgi:hypothetical protein
VAENGSTAAWLSRLTSAFGEPEAESEGAMATPGFAKSGPPLFISMLEADRQDSAIPKGAKRIRPEIATLPLSNPGLVTTGHDCWI